MNDRFCVKGVLQTHQLNTICFFSQVGAVCADMLTKDSAAIITITPYFTGSAPVRIENCTQLEICYKQNG